MSETLIPPDRQDAPHDADAPGRVDTPIRCITCGYNLLGLDEGSVCPECATPVRDSTEGTLLGHSAPEYIHTLHAGSFYVLLSVVLGVFFALAAVVVVAVFSGAAPGATGVSPAAEILQQVGGLALTLLGLYGWWKLTTPDPAYTGVDTGRDNRRLLRAVVAIMAAIAVLTAPINIIFAVQPGGFGQSFGPLTLALLVIGLANFGLFLVQFFASLNYIAWLGRRVPDPEIVARAHRYRWLLPVISILGLLVIVGPFIAFIMYYMLINRLRRRLKALDEPFAMGELAPQPAPTPTAPA